MIYLGVIPKARDNSVDRNKKLISKKLTALIIDDHKIVASLLKSYLLEMQIFREVYLGHTGKQVMESLSECDCDIIILDIILPDMNGLELISYIKKVKPKAKIIFFTSMISKKVISACYKLGALGFLSKSSNYDDIKVAIETVLNGERYACKECLQAMLDDTVTNFEYEHYISSLESLSEREKEILELLVNELNVPEIAKNLCLSKRTVETHKKNIMTKLGVKTSAGLIKLVVEKGLLLEHPVL